MPDETLTQQQLDALRVVDDLASLNPSLETDKNRLEAIYRERKNQIQTFINDKENLDMHIGEILEKINSQGIHSLSPEELEKLRAMMFTGFMITHTKLSELKHQGESVSKLNLEFAESIKNINNAYRRAHEIKKKKKAEFIQDLVHEYGSNLRLEPEQVEKLHQDFSKREEELRQLNRDRPLPLEIYVQELEGFAAKASYVPPEKLQRKEEFSISKRLESLYEDIAVLDREEVTYRKLQKEIIRQEKDVTIHEDITRIRPPYVALEAAAAILLREQPKNQPDEIIEEALRLGPALVGYQAPGYERSPSDMSRDIYQTIALRHGDLAAKESQEYLESIKNQPELLREFQRVDTQRSLLAILKNPSLVEKIFTHIDDNPQAKRAFEAFVNSPFFTQIYKTLKQQVDQSHGSQLQGLLNIAASGTNTIIGERGPNSTSPEKNHALFFMMTTDRLAALREHPALYKRFMRMFRPSSQNFPLPENSQQSLLALAVFTSDPHRLPGYDLIALAMQSGMHRIDHHYHPLYTYLQKITEFKKRHPQYQRMVQDMLIRKVYTIYLLGRNPGAILETLREFQGVIPNKLATSVPGMAKNFSLLSRVVSSGAKIGIQRLIAGSIGGIPGLLLVAGLAMLKKALNHLSGGLFNKIEKVANPINWIPYIIGGVLIFILVITGVGLGSPVVTQQTVMPVFLDKNILISKSSNIPIINCAINPSDPVCTICSGPDGQRDPLKCAWPVSSGCIVQGPNPYHATEPGGQGIDIGESANGLPVRATFPGQVIETRWGFLDGQKTLVPNYGNMVRIRTSTNPSFIVVYAHLRQTFEVKVGQIVEPNTIIGYVDNTGYGSGSHLHMEIQGVPAGNVVPFPIPPCVGLKDCKVAIQKSSGNSSCW